MTEQELDIMMQRVLLDAIKFDYEKEKRTNIPFSGTEKYHKSIISMLEDPLRWERKKSGWTRKRTLQLVATFFLVFSLSLGGLMVVSPTVRAAFIQWVMELYETHITYRYTGDVINGMMPQYEITKLPEGYTECKEERIEGTNYVGIVYRSETDDNVSPIFFDYIYMQQGSASDQDIENKTILDVVVNGMEGQIYLSNGLEKADSTITWIDVENNLQFSVDAVANENDLLRMAESVSLNNKN